jgi:hypothetical protein
MGGFGSGRRGGGPTSEACGSYVLESWLLDRAKLRAGILGTTSFTYRDGFAVKLTIDVRSGAWHFIDFEHERHTSDAAIERYRVGLLRTFPRFGGARWWFECPRTANRVAKLFLPRGGHRFWSRAGYGLGYASQRETPLDRVHRQGAKLCRHLGDASCWPHCLPPKPKGMRWRTYERKQERFEALAARLDRVWNVGAMKLLARLG